MYDRSQLEQEKLVQILRDTIHCPDISWVLFENGTYVIISGPEADLATQATTLLRMWGPVYPGSSFADFTTMTLNNQLGWVVICHHNDILTFVSMDEVDQNTDDLKVGLLGRFKRGKDAQDLHILHVEDNRPA